MDRLPVKLLLQIGNHIEADSRPKKTLFALIRTCRRFHDIFFSILYHTITISPVNLALVRLIMRLWQQPELALLVRRVQLARDELSDTEPLEITEITEPQNMTEPLDIPMPTDVAAFFHEALDTIMTPDEKQSPQSQWLRGVTGISAETWTWLLLICARDVETVQFDYKMGWAFAWIIARAVSNLVPLDQRPAFRRLKNIEPVSSWESPWVKSGFLDFVFHLPAVETIIGNGIYEQSIPENPPLPNVPSNVRVIDIGQVAWCGGLLDWLVKCNKLEHLYLGFDVAPNSRGSSYEVSAFKAASLRQHLLPSAATLKSIGVFFSAAYREFVIDAYLIDNENSVMNLPFGSLKQFPVLETVTMRHCHLLGRMDPVFGSNQQRFAEILPGSLEALFITDLWIGCENALFRALVVFVRSGACPNLRTLQVGLDTERKGGTDAAVDMLARECQSRGIEFYIWA